MLSAALHAVAAISRSAAHRARARSSIMSRAAIALEPEAPYWLGGAVEVTPHVTEALATGGAVSPFLALDYAPARKRRRSTPIVRRRHAPRARLRSRHFVLGGRGARRRRAGIKEGDVRWLTAARARSLKD